MLFKRLQAPACFQDVSSGMFSPAISSGQLMTGQYWNGRLRCPTSKKGRFLAYGQVRANVNGLL